MKLNEFMDHFGWATGTISRRTGIPYPTVKKIVEGGDPRLSHAYRIEQITMGVVSIEELIPMNKIRRNGDGV